MRGSQVMFLRLRILMGRTRRFLAWVNMRMCLLGRNPVRSLSGRVEYSPERHEKEDISAREGLCARNPMAGTGVPQNSR